ncbi:MAG: zinc-binding dehydrogenase [Candidatus Poseidoniales archaeon]
MRRVVYTKRGGMDAIEISESPTPSPGMGEVLIEVHRAGINFADLMMRQGLYSPVPPFPFTPGYEISGVVKELGGGVEGTGLIVGDRVVSFCGMGGYSEQIVSMAERCFKLPESISFDIAAALPVTYLTAHHMLAYLGNFQPGDSILVHHAAGGVGTATAQLAKALGASKVFGTASGNKAEFVRSLGMHFIDREADDFVEVCKRETDGLGVHHALDPVGGKHMMRSYKALRSGGRLYAFGGSAAVKGSKRSIVTALRMLLTTPKFNPFKMMTSNKAVFGVHMGTFKDENVLKNQIFSLLKMLDEGSISPIVDKVFRFEEVAAAQQYIHDRKNRGKVLLDFSPKSN